MNCVQLKSLKVSTTKGAITDESIELVATNCRQLRLLWVSETCGAITDDSIKLVAMNCPYLRSLAPCSTEGMITEESLSLVHKHCLVYDLETPLYSSTRLDDSEDVSLSESLSSSVV